MARKTLLLVCRQAPYNGTLARAALELGLAAAAFNQTIDLLFLDDGVWQLLPDQEAAAIDRKSLSATVASLSLYDLETLYVAERSLAARQLDFRELAGTVRVLDDAALAEFMDAHDQVLSF
jgi:tRNA 2-thiouridine synthesizing protein C